VRAELDALGEGLQRRASVAAARSILELMQDTAHAMSKARRISACRLNHHAIALSRPSYLGSGHTLSEAEVMHCMSCLTFCKLKMGRSDDTSRPPLHVLACASCDRHGLSCAQVEKLLEEVDASTAPGGTSSSPEALDSRIRLYERVASEVSRLNFHAAKGASLPFVLQLAPRIQAATAKLKARCWLAQAVSDLGHVLG
jgi:hypothetical protein